MDRQDWETALHPVDPLHPVILSNLNRPRHSPSEAAMPMPKNVLGTELETCCTDPMTGFYRDGCCRTGPDDHGLHLVCIEANDEFLAFSKSRGNDLSTPIPQYQFPGLVAGDAWSKELDGSKDLIGDWVGKKCGNYNTKTNKCGGQGS